VFIKILAEKLLFLDPGVMSDWFVGNLNRVSNVFHKVIALSTDKETLTEGEGSVQLTS
jgi:hypothetical protein